MLYSDNVIYMEPVKSNFYDNLKKKFETYCHSNQPETICDCFDSCFETAECLLDSCHLVALLPRYAIACILGAQGARTGGAALRVKV